MKTVSGVVKFVNENEKSDNIVLEDDTRIYLKKGEAKQFFGSRGKKLTAKVNPSEFKGKEYLYAQPGGVSVEGGKSNITAVAGGNVDFNTRAARGQALNLAVMAAIAEKKHMDDDFIMSQIDRFLNLSDKVQSGETKKDVF